MCWREGLLVSKTTHGALSGARAEMLIFFARDSHATTHSDHALLAVAARAVWIDLARATWVALHSHAIDEDRAAKNGIARILKRRIDCL